MYYCSAVWSNTSQRNIEKLQAVQNFAARIVTGTRKYDHVTPVLQQLGWLPVKYMLKLREAIFAFKCLKGLAPLYLCEKFHVRSDVHGVNTEEGLPEMQRANQCGSLLFKLFILNAPFD